MARPRESDAVTAFVSVDPALVGRERRELREGISTALQANLSRGFLESEERFRQIVEGLHQVVWLTNPEGTQLYFVNAAYEQLWGTPRDAMSQRGRLSTRRTTMTSIATPTRASAHAKTPKT